jgi:hypothetical protein
MLSAGAAMAENVSSGGRVETDLYLDATTALGALLDGDVATHFPQQRLADAEWRIWLKAPATLASVAFVQGWSGWSQATSVRLETADGSTADLTLVAGTRDKQTFPLPFQSPTAFVDVHVIAATPQTDGGGWGGFAEIELDGSVAAGDTKAPAVSAINVNKQSDTLATVTWTTDEPATSQVRFSSEAVAAGDLVGVVATAPDKTLTTAHSVTLQAAAPLRGQIEIRSADAVGNRTEVRHDAFVTIDTAFKYGVGGWSFKIGSQWVAAPKVYADDGVPMAFVQAWAGGTGWADWLTSKSLADIKAAGMTPEIIHYFFGDPKLADVQARTTAFLADIDTLAQVLTASGAGAGALVTLEPEYNQNEVATWDGWNDLMIQAIDKLHAVGAKVGLLPGDWDIGHTAIISMGRAAAKADFVAFQEMRASTQDTPEEARQVVSKAIRFSHYLSRKLLRPVRWGYLMVSDYGGWEAVQRDVVIEMCERRPELEASGVVAVSWMDYLDDPGQTTGYFQAAEAHKGLKNADNTPKPAWHVWKECVTNGPSWVAAGTAAPGEIPAKEESGCSCSEAPGRGGAGWAATLGVALAWMALRRRKRFSQPWPTDTACARETRRTSWECAER